MKLSTNAILLLKYTLSYSGQIEVGQNGQDVLSPRKLNGEESSQRRHFFKSVEEVTTNYDKMLREEQNKVMYVQNKLKEDLKKEFTKLETEKDEEYEERINKKIVENKELIERVEEINKIIKDKQEEEQEFDITPKTLEVVKKYFVKYGDQCGFMPNDDKSVEEIERVICA